MKVIDIDITPQLKKALNTTAFLFNPSIARVKDDLFLVSVRSFIHDPSKPPDSNPLLKNNTQHPWKTGWKGATDFSLIVPVRITGEKFEPLATGEWPIKTVGKDLRLYKFIDSEKYSVYILTFNKIFQDPDILIKGGERCDEDCFIIGWALMIVNTDTLDVHYVESNEPLCSNISNKQDKNWSVWSFKIADRIHTMLSYELVPFQSAFEFSTKNIITQGGKNCGMITPNYAIVYKGYQLLSGIEQLYENNVIISLSTPAYEIVPGLYQAVGHMKVKLAYLFSLIGSTKTPLARFATKYIVPEGGKVHYHSQYVYFMFIYRFTSIATNVVTRINLPLTTITPAFVGATEEYDYFLNFPSGIHIGKDNTIISYGDGDKTSHLMKIKNGEVEAFLESISELIPETFLFSHAKKNINGEMEFLKA